MKADGSGVHKDCGFACADFSENGKFKTSMVEDTQQGRERREFSLANFIEWAWGDTKFEECHHHYISEDLKHDVRSTS